MIIALIGASCSGKSIVEKYLSNKYGFEKIVSYTTRIPREGEVNGRDYNFIDNEKFLCALNNNLFAEYDEYSHNRFYGTLKSDYKTKRDKVVVLTPNGYRQLKKNCPNQNILTVLIEANLGTRIKRYIDRCGDKFNYSDASEIFERVNRDFGMFLGIEKEVDLVVMNNEGTHIENLIKQILEKVD